MCKNLKILLVSFMVSVIGLSTEQAQAEFTLAERLGDLHDALLEAEINGDEVTVFLSEPQMATIMGMSIKNLFSGKRRLAKKDLLLNMEQLETLGDEALSMKERLLKLGFKRETIGWAVFKSEFFVMPDPSGKYFLSLVPNSFSDAPLEVPYIKHCVGFPDFGFFKNNCFGLLRDDDFWEEGRVDLKTHQGRIGLLEEIRNIQSDQFNSYAIPRDQRPRNTSPNPTTHQTGRATSRMGHIAQRTGKGLLKGAAYGLGGLAGIGVFIEIGIFGWEFLQSRDVEETLTEGIKINRHVYKDLSDHVAYLSEVLSNDEVNDSLGIDNGWQANPVNSIPSDPRIRAIKY